MPHPSPPPSGEGISKTWQRYYYIGPDKDADVLDGLDRQAVDALQDADFLLNVGFGSEEQSTQDITPLLRQALALGLPMLCLNPDLEVVKITGGRYPCAGVIAHAYEAMGGEVVWFGKPYPAVYEHCMKILSSPLPLEGGAGEGGVSLLAAESVTPPHPASPSRGGGEVRKSRVLAVGDSLETDIPGAVNFGLDCALVTGGILNDKSPQEITALCRELKLEPDYVMSRLVF